MKVIVLPPTSLVLQVYFKAKSREVRVQNLKVEKNKFPTLRMCTLFSWDLILESLEYTRYAGDMRSWKTVPSCSVTAPSPPRSSPPPWYSPTQSRSTRSATFCNHLPSSPTMRTFMARSGQTKGQQYHRDPRRGGSSMGGPCIRPPRPLHLGDLSGLNRGGGDGEGVYGPFVSPAFGAFSLFKLAFFLRG